LAACRAGAGFADQAGTGGRRCGRWSGPGSGARAGREHWAGASSAGGAVGPMWSLRLLRRRPRASADLVTVAPRVLSAGAAPAPVGRETPSDAVLSLSVFDPFFIGIDEFGHPVRLPMMFRNVLAAGEPGGGKSGFLNGILAHGALDPSCRLVLLDGKQ